MKAVRIHSFGTPDVLVYEDTPTPTPGPGQVLVRVHAAGINPVDYKTRAGSGVAGNFGAQPFPLILGWDVAGVVEAHGTSEFPNGTPVYGMIGFPGVGAAYAEYAVADPHELARTPHNLDFANAAGLPLAVLTAWQALFDAGDLQAGQRILIHAAAGGVGHLAVQLAKWRGAYVIGTASKANEEYLRALGVDQFIDYTTQRFETEAGAVDFALNTVSVKTAVRSLEVLKPGGTLISITGGADPGLAAARNMNAQNILVKGNGGQLAQIAGLIEQGVIKPTVETILPLAEAAKAHLLVEAGHTRGKISLTI